MSNGSIIQEQIKKAMKACNHSTPHCSECPYSMNVELCRIILCNAILAGITGQEQQFNQVQIDVINKLKETCYKGGRR